MSVKNTQFPTFFVRASVKSEGKVELTSIMDPPGFEPGASRTPSGRSTAELRARTYLLPQDLKSLVPGAVDTRGRVVLKQ